ncbi:MAG: hypothetical protein Q8O93_02495, partial [bacterium]|nr:hypothetical protein [bacterium]
MSLKIFKKTLFFLTAVFLTLGLSIAFQSLLAAWAPPLADPPTCAEGDPGCDPPLNHGPLLQHTHGALWLINENYPTNPYGLIVENGNVGVGTVAPSGKLEIESGGSGVANSMFYLDNTGADDARFRLFTSGGEYYIRTDVKSTGAANNLHVGDPGTASGLVVQGQIKVLGGSPGAGKVLTSDAAGLASWQTPAASAEADTLQTVTARDNSTSYGLAINGQTIDHNSNNFFYLNSYDGLQLRINADGAGSSNFQI